MRRVNLLHILLFLCSSYGLMQDIFYMAIVNNPLLLNVTCFYSEFHKVTKYYYSVDKQIQKFPKASDNK